MGDIIIKEKLKSEFLEAMQQVQIICFHAPCGYGKTTAAKRLLEGKRIYYMSAMEEILHFPKEGDDWEVLLLDDLRYLTDERDWKTVRSLIGKFPDKKFVFLTRGKFPNWLIEYKLSERMATFDIEYFLWEQTEIKGFLKRFGIKLSSTELAMITKETYGHPIALLFLVKMLKRGKKINSMLIRELRYEVFNYIEGAMLLRLEPEFRKTLVCLSLFEEFDLRMAQVITDNEDIDLYLERLRRFTYVLRESEHGVYSFWDIFADFLRWEIPSYLRQRERNDIYCRVAEYYTNIGKEERAMDYYKMAGATERLAVLIERNACFYPGFYNSAEIIRNLPAVPRERIMASPALIQAACMVASLQYQPEEAEEWFHLLEQQVSRPQLSDTVKRDIKNRLMWLNIVLPHRSPQDLISRLEQIAKLYERGEIELLPIPFNSSVPSLLNGGRDFSELLLNFEHNHAQLQQYLAQILGQVGYIYVECANIEVRYIRGEDANALLVQMLELFSQGRNKTALEIEFVMVGLLTELLIGLDRLEEALNLVAGLKRRCIDAGSDRFLLNLEAMLCRIQIYADNLGAVESWYNEQDSLDCISIDVQKRYQYFTQAMAGITLEKYSEALLTVVSLEAIISDNKRCIDQIDIHILKAIIYYRCGNSAWRECLISGLGISEQYGMKRIISKYGNAVLPLLNSLDVEKTSFLKEVQRLSRMQATYYPYFMQPFTLHDDELTPAEYQVFRLVYAGKSNKEIGEILGIKLPTVKTHVGRILSKMGVKRRSELRIIAEKLL